MKKRMGNFLLGIFSVTMFLIFLTTPVAAVPILDFGIVAPTSGSISYSGGINPLIGANIQVDNLVGFETPNHDGVQLNIIGGKLNFQTGNLISSGGGILVFGGGPSSSFTITGGVSFNSDTDTDDPGDIANTTLLSGFFNDSLVSNQGIFKVTLGSLVTFLNPDLLAAYGFPISQSLLGFDGFLNISFKPSYTLNGGFTSDPVLSGDVGTIVPEPATMLLLGSGLLGLGFFTRKKFKTKKTK